jgi:hypothetical protein
MKTYFTPEDWLISVEVGSQKLKPIQVSKITTNTVLKTVNSSTPVLAINTAQLPAIEIVPNKGETFKVPRAAKIAVRSSGYRDKMYGEEFCLSFETDKEIYHEAARSRHKLYRKALLFPTQELEVSPYVIGYWVCKGEGVMLRVSQKEILERLKVECANSELKIDLTQIAPVTTEGKQPIGSRGGKAGKLTFTAQLSANFRAWCKQHNYINSFMIPEKYMCGDLQQRALLLSGVLDAIGYLSPHNATFDITIRNDYLLEQVCQLANTLGFYSHKKGTNKVNVQRFKKQRRPELIAKTVNRVYISGDRTVLSCADPNKNPDRPAKTNVSHVTGFDIDELEHPVNFIELVVNNNELLVNKDYIVMRNSI